MSEIKQLFCSKPFKWCEVSRGNREGQLFLCCPAWLATSVGNLGDQSVLEIWNSARAQDIRRSILDGSFRYCNRSLCPNLQSVTDSVCHIENMTDPDLLAILGKGLTVLP